MPSDNPPLFEARDDRGEVSREEYKILSGDESVMDVTKSAEMETDVIDLSGDDDVEIVTETIDLTGGRLRHSDVEIVEEVIDLTDDSKESQGEVASDASEEDMEVEEVHHNINSPQLEDHLDEAQLALVHEILNQDLQEKALKEDKIHNKEQLGCSKWSEEWSGTGIGDVSNVEVSSAIKVGAGGEEESTIQVENTVQPFSDKPNTSNAPQTPRVEEVYNSLMNNFNELLNAPTPTSTTMSLFGGELMELGTSDRSPEQESEVESDTESANEIESESESDTESEMDEESEEDQGDQAYNSRSKRCRDRYRTNIHKAIEETIPSNREQIAQLQISFRENFSFLAGTIGGPWNPEQIYVFLSNARGNFFNNTNVDIGQYKFKKRSQWNVAYESELDCYIKCQRDWIKALKKSSSMRKKAVKLCKRKTKILKLLSSVDVKDAHLQGMQAELIDPNCTKFTKEDTKQACRASLENAERDLSQVEDTEEIDFLMNGLTDLLRTQKIFLGILNEELKEKTRRVNLYKNHFENNLNGLMS